MDGTIILKPAPAADVKLSMGTMEIHVLEVDGKKYADVGDAGWPRTRAARSSMVDSFSPEKMFGSVSGQPVAQMQKVGDEDKNGVATTHYKAGADLMGQYGSLVGSTFGIPDGSLDLRGLDRQGRRLRRSRTSSPEPGRSTGRTRASRCRSTSRTSTARQQGDRALRRHLARRSTERCGRRQPGRIARSGPATSVGYWYQRQRGRGYLRPAEPTRRGCEHRGMRERLRALVRRAVFGDVAARLVPGWRPILVAVVTVAPLRRRSPSCPGFRGGRRLRDPPGHGRRGLPRPASRDGRHRR